MRLILLALFSIQLTVLADKVVIKDGSILIGTVLGSLDGNLTIETEFAGKTQNSRLPDCLDQLGF